MAIGDKVQYMNYGVLKEGHITRIAENGSIVWIGNRWLHRESVTKIG